MAQKGCEQIALLLSKYADGEATPDELKAVSSHVAACAECSRKLAEYNELAAIFSATPKRDAEPQLRVNVFRELDRIHREEARKSREASRLPLPVSSSSIRHRGRLW